ITELHVESGQTVEVGASLLTIDLDPHGPPPADTSASSGGEAAATGSDPASDSSEESAEEEMKPLVGYGSTESSTTRRPRKTTATPAAGSTATSPSPEVVSGASPAAASTTPAGEPTTPAAGSRVPLAKPPVRKLAKDLGVNLYTVTGSAAGGVITRADVQHAANGVAATATPETPERPAPATAPDDGSRETRVPIKGVLKATAQAMVESAFTAPHVTEFLSVDVTAMMDMRERLKQQPSFAGVK